MAGCGTTPLLRISGKRVSVPVGGRETEVGETYLRQLVQDRWLFVFIELENGHRRAGDETQHGGAEARSRGVIWEIAIRGIFRLGEGR